MESPVRIPKLSGYTIFTIWILAVCIGFFFLEKYKSTPGKAGTEFKVLPPQSEIDLSDKPYTLVMFGHPKCPCSRASLVELEKLMSVYSKNFGIKIIFYHPKTATPDWFETDIVAKAKSLPDVKVTFDPDGRLANIIGARTSGMTYVFDKQRRQIFMGGITGSRGHEGENDGTRSIASIAETGKPILTTTKVFGCSLFKSDGRLTSTIE
ncbi:MAG: hypothetical protein ABIQ95_05165 [Bdellovibrionia bacterium]